MAAMQKPANVDKRDRRDKRFIARRRRVRLPWFLLASLTVLLGFAWVTKRLAPDIGHHFPAAHTADKTSPQGYDFF